MSFPGRDRTIARPPQQSKGTNCRPATPAGLQTRPSIMVVNPNTSTAMTALCLKSCELTFGEKLQFIGSSGTESVATVESCVDEVHGAMSVIDQVRAGEASGVDAYVIACFGDTGLWAARQLASGPVIGMSEAALYTASMVAARFSIVTMPVRTRESAVRVVHEAGLAHRCTVRAIDEPVAATLVDSNSELLHRLAAAARAAIAEDYAEAIILGCAGLGDLATALEADIGVPVIDGVVAGVALADALLTARITTSRANTFAPEPDAGEQQ
ncbi:aspartate/glutamate racemase family protein [Gordonia polyisoprenivorans]|uniref:aspartate/glutamate racemase family protein n=1 Tax=Gordonia polyisoprenivorans TaxID=84595 RepID=UPI0030CB9854